MLALLGTENYLWCHVPLLQVSQTYSADLNSCSSFPLPLSLSTPATQATVQCTVAAPEQSSISGAQSSQVKLMTGTKLQSTITTEKIKRASRTKILHYFEVVNCLPGLNAYSYVLIRIGFTFKTPFFFSVQYTWNPVSPP